MSTYRKRLCPRCGKREATETLTKTPAPPWLIDFSCDSCGLSLTRIPYRGENAGTTRKHIRQAAMTRVEIPKDLAAQVIEDIEAMGNDAPLSLKQLWGYLNPRGEE